MTCFCRVGDASLTAVLPLELDLILLGYSKKHNIHASTVKLKQPHLGDGYIRQASCSAFLSHCHEPASSPLLAAHGDKKQLFDAQSRVSISSSIQSLHFIRNESTGDAFIVGGSDDGGITVWSLR